MINLRDLIRNVQTRAQPSTWGALATWLTTELARIKQEGRIMIDPPQVILPDGVTTTSLVSQSEMTQFVTNTLNTWLATMGEFEGYDIEAMLKPAFYNFVGDPDHYWQGTKGAALSVKYLSNYKAMLETYFSPDPESPGGGSLTDIYYYTIGNIHPSGTVLEAGLGWDGYHSKPLPFLSSFIRDAQYGHFDNIVVRFVDAALLDDYSNLKTLIDNNPAFLIHQNQVFKYSQGNEVIRYLRFKPEPRWRAEDKTRMLVSLQQNGLSSVGVATSNFTELPLFEIEAPAPWIPSDDTEKAYIEIMAAWPTLTIE